MIDRVDYKYGRVPFSPEGTVIRPSTEGEWARREEKGGVVLCSCAGSREALQACIALRPQSSTAGTGASERAKCGGVLQRTLAREEARSE